MRIARLGLPTLFALLMVVFPAIVAAHVELAATSPSDGANLDEPPDEVVITFEGELDPEASEFTVTDSAGAEVGSGEVDLDVADRNEMRGDVDISEPGVYTVSWQATAADGHEESGEFRFGYRADPAATAADAPNTAVSHTDGAHAEVFAGLALIAAAVVLGARSRRDAAVARRR